MFNNFELEFNNDLTIMIGCNGTGKTTILETINSILSEKFDYFNKSREFTFVELDILQNDNVKNIRLEKINSNIEFKVDGKRVENLKEYLEFNKVIYLPPEVNFKNIKLDGVRKFDRDEEKSLTLDSERMSKQVKQFLVNEKYKDLNDIAEGNIEKANRIEKFKNLYNNFFEDKAFFGIDNDTFEPQFRLKDTAEVMKVEDLSSGEKQIFFRGGSLLQNINYETIVLLDEPELSMHPEWKQKILGFYKNICKDSQCIISTNSPHIISCDMQEEIRSFSKEEGKIRVSSYNLL